jgi:hypothetical protein
MFPLRDRTKRDYLLPLYDSRSAILREQQVPNRHLISVYEAETRALVGFDDLPTDLQRYLRVYEKVLRKRFIVSEKSREWWSTIDPINPDLLHRPKVLIPDFHPGSAVRFDSGSLFPAHTVLYMTGSTDGLQSLTRLLQSPIADLHRASHAPRLRGGTLRASSTALAKLPCPPINDLIEAVAGTSGFDPIYQAYGLTKGEISLVETVHSSLVCSS